jgi:hypothetical protein
LARAGARVHARAREPHGMPMERPHDSGSGAPFIGLASGFGERSSVSANYTVWVIKKRSFAIAARAPALTMFVHGK